MEAPLRAVIAFIIGRLIIGSQAWAILDHDRGHPVFIDGSVEPSGIRVYIHELGTYISGHGNGTYYQLFEHRRAIELSFVLSAAGKSFAGFDQRGPFRFFGEVAGAEIRIFDFEDMASHCYTF